MFGKLKNSITRALVIRVLRGFMASGALWLATNGYLEESAIKVVGGALGYIAVAVYSVMESGTPPRVMFVQYAALAFAGVLAGAGLVTPEQAATILATVFGTDAIGGTAMLDLAGMFVTVGTQVKVTKINERNGTEIRTDRSEGDR